MSAKHDRASQATNTHLARCAYLLASLPERSAFTPPGTTHSFELTKQMDGCEIDGDRVLVAYATTWQDKLLLADVELSIDLALEKGVDGVLRMLHDGCKRDALELLTGSPLAPEEQARPDVAR